MKFDNKQFGSASALLTMVQQDAIAQVVCVAAELRIADLLAGGPKWVSFSRSSAPQVSVAITSI